MLGEERHRPPGGHDCTDHHQESDPAAAELGILHSLRGPALTVPPPSEPIADEKGQAEADDQLGQEVLEVEDVAQLPAR